MCARLERASLGHDPGKTIELDIYDGPLAGLMVAEVAFADEQRAGAFVAPDWFGGDVTDDVRYKNQTLVLLNRDERERRARPARRLS